MVTVVSTMVMDGKEVGNMGKVGEKFGELLYFYLVDCSYIS